MIIQMHDPQGCLLREAGDRRISQYSLALTYSFIMRQEMQTADWGAVNGAILEKRGMRALENVKRMAWEICTGKTAPGNRTMMIQRFERPEKRR